MEVPQIEEMRLSTEIDEAEHRREVRSTEVGARKCIYDKEIECTAPNCNMKVCEKCPYGCKYTFAGTVKDVFNKIVSMAIFLAKSDDVLRDVIALLSKAKDVEMKTGDEPKSKVKAEVKDKIEDEVVIKKEPVPQKNVKAKPINRDIAQVQANMAAEIAGKVADINEALANPNGSSDKPLV